MRPTIDPDPDPDAEPGIDDTLRYVKYRNRAPCALSALAEDEPETADALYDDVVEYYAKYHTGLTTSQFTSVFLLDLTAYRQDTRVVLQ